MTTITHSADTSNISIILKLRVWAPGKYKLNFFSFQHHQLLREISDSLLAERSAAFISWSPILPVYHLVLKSKCRKSLSKILAANCKLENIIYESSESEPNH